MAYLVHHTLNRNGTCTGGKRNPLPIHGKSPTDESQYRKKSETNKSTLVPFKTYGRRYDFECPIHGIINSDKIEGAYFGRICSMC